MSDKEYWNNLQEEFLNKELEEHNNLSRDAVVEDRIIDNPVKGARFVEEDESSEDDSE